MNDSAGARLEPEATVHVLNTLSQLAGLSDATLSEYELLDAFHKLLAHALVVDLVCIGLSVGEGEEMKLAIPSNPNARCKDFWGEVRDVLVKTALQKEETIRAAAGESGALGELSGSDDATVLVSPLLYRRYILGIVAARAPEDATFSEGEVLLFSWLARQLGILLMCRRLQEMNRALRERFKAAGAVTHEMNQPLTGVAGYCTLIEEELDEDHPFFNDMREIKRQAYRLEELVRHLQQIIRPQSSEDSDEE